MAEGPASFWTQADALLRKSLTFQKRNMKQNIRLIVIPVLLVMLLYGLKSATNAFSKHTEAKCSCDCYLVNNEYKCSIKCEDGHKDDAGNSCPVTNPHSELPMIQVPNAKSRAVRNNLFMSNDFPDETCRRKGACPVVVLLTGNDASLGKGLGNLMFSSYSFNISDPVSSLVNNVLGSATGNKADEKHIYQVQSQCGSKASYIAPIPVGNSLFSNITCVQGLPIWRNSSLEVNDILYKGYSEGNSERKVNKILAAYDVSISDKKNFDVTIQYNATLSKKELVSDWLPRLLNMLSNAYLQFLKGPGTKMAFQFVKDMPMPAPRAPGFQFDIASLFGPLFYSWVALLLFPVVLGALVYEKQEKLRIMMKMHGLGDGPYWMISYAYFLLTSMVYFFALVAFGSFMGLEFFKLNSYSVQFVFYFIYTNLQISWAFFLAAFFSRVKTATVLGYILVFATGLLGMTLFYPLTQSISDHWIIVLELYPGFSLYRGMGEFGSYAGSGKGLTWDQVFNGNSPMKEVLIIMIYEWFGMLFVAYYVDQIGSTGSGVPKSPLFFLKIFTKKPILQRQYLGSEARGQLEKPDVQQEVEKVQQLLRERNLSYSILINNLKKIYQRRDGNPEKHAVNGLSLAIPSGECFGMLGPNGAGKTSFISMMIGLTDPTSGTAYVEKMDIRTQMDSVYTKMGVCPQHDLLWETLTGREHLLFYGRLKNLKGAALHQAVEESLKGLNLFQGGVADKPAGKYSGGMKRRLSVAISLIGDPKVVYMDEPSTGLDPASRYSLWNVVKRAKRGRAIILTTHSMEEAEYLCDRLGIFVDGSLQCIGNPKELKARYGGTYIFTITTSSEHEAEVERLVTILSPNAKRVYHLSGTQKFELPKHEVNMADVFSAVEDAKRQFTVQAWGIADTTLEDVFIKVARGAEIFNEESSMNPPM